MLSKKRDFSADLDDMDDFLNRLEGEVKVKRLKAESSSSTTPIQRPIDNQYNQLHDSRQDDPHLLFNRVDEFLPSRNDTSPGNSPAPLSSNADKYNEVVEKDGSAALSPQWEPLGELKKLNNSGQRFISSVDLIGIESASKNLQAAIYKILEEAPSYSELKQYVSDDPKILNSKYFILATKLREAVENGKLKVFNDIAEFSENSVFNDPTGLDGEIKAPIEYVIFDSNNNQRQMVNINYEDYVDYVPPPLPVIKDDHLYDQVFAHKSLDMSRCPDYIQETNERLIYLGESVLSNVISRLFYRRFPELRDDFLVNERRELLSSTNLTKWSCLYSLDQQVNSMVPHAKTKQKIYGECFYAYVGALSIQFGNDICVILQWIEALIEPAIQKLNLAEPINKSAKGELNLAIGSQACTPSYHSIQTGDNLQRQFIVECRMGSEVLGVGEAANLKDAGIRAAMAALKNREVMEKFTRMNRLNPTTTSGRLMIEDGRSSSYDNYQLSSSNQLVVSDKFGESLLLNLPIIAPPMDKADIDLKSKDRLYSLLLQSRKLPQYDIERLDDANMKATLSVDGIPLVIAFERNKKISSQKAAQVMLSNLGVLKSLHFL